MAYAAIFEQYESRLPAYCRDIWVAFGRASGHLRADRNGLASIDFLAGAGALNRGHNDPQLKRAVVDSAATGAVLPRQSARSGAAELSCS